jgi:signal recognition particle receptor subunit beta
MVLANKCDLPREATVDDVKTCAEAIGAIGAVDTSAKNGENVNDAFMRLTKAILKKQ